MNVFCLAKMDVVAFVREMLDNSEQGYVLTMTITPVKSGGYYAHIATDASLAGFEELKGYVYSPRQPSISQVHTLDG